MGENTKWQHLRGVIEKEHEYTDDECKKAVETWKDFIESDSWKVAVNINSNNLSDFKKGMLCGIDGNDENIRNNLKKCLARGEDFKARECICNKLLERIRQNVGKLNGDPKTKLIQLSEACSSLFFYSLSSTGNADREGVITKYINKVQDFKLEDTPEKQIMSQKEEPLDSAIETQNQNTSNFLPALVKIKNAGELDDKKSESLKKYLYYEGNNDSVEDIENIENIKNNINKICNYALLLRNGYAKGNTNASNNFINFYLGVLKLQRLNEDEWRTHSTEISTWYNGAFQIICNSVAFCSKSKNDSSTSKSGDSDKNNSIKKLTFSDISLNVLKLGVSENYKNTIEKLRNDFETSDKKIDEESKNIFKNYDYKTRQIMKIESKLDVKDEDDFKKKLQDETIPNYLLKLKRQYENVSLSNYEDFKNCVNAIYNRVSNISHENKDKDIDIDNNTFKEYKKAVESLIMVAYVSLDEKTVSNIKQNEKKLKNWEENKKSKSGRLLNALYKFCKSSNILNGDIDNKLGYSKIWKREVIDNLKKIKNLSEDTDIKNSATNKWSNEVLKKLEKWEKNYKSDDDRKSKNALSKCFDVPKLFISKKSALKNKDVLKKIKEIQKSIKNKFVIKN